MRRTAWILISILFLFALSSLAPAKDKGDKKGEAKEEEKVELPPFFLAKTKGKVYIVAWDKEKKKAVKRKAKAPMAVAMNDRIVTGKRARAYLQFKDGGTVEVGPESEVFVQEIDVTPKTFRARFLLALGRFRATVKKLTGTHSTFEVEAGGVVAGVRGTTFEVEYDKKEDQAVAKTYEGRIYTRSDGEEQWVKEGFSLAFSAGGGAVSGSLDTDDIKDFAEFINIAGDLEKKKEILLKQLKKQLLKKATGGLLDAGKDGKTGIHFGF